MGQRIAVIKLRRKLGGRLGRRNNCNEDKDSILHTPPCRLTVPLIILIVTEEDANTNFGRKKPPLMPPHWEPSARVDYPLQSRTTLTATGAVSRNRGAPRTSIRRRRQESAPPRYIIYVFPDLITPRRNAYPSTSATRFYPTEELRSRAGEAVSCPASLPNATTTLTHYGSSTSRPRRTAVALCIMGRLP